MTASETFHTSASLAWMKTPLVPLELTPSWVGSIERLEVMDKKEVLVCTWNRIQIPQTTSVRFITVLTELYKLHTYRSIKKGLIYIFLLKDLHQT